MDRDHLSHTKQLVETIQRNMHGALQEVLGEETESRSRANKRSIMAKSMQYMSQSVRAIEAQITYLDGIPFGEMSEEDALREIAALEKEIRDKDALLSAVEADLRRWTSKSGPVVRPSSTSNRKRRR